MTITPGTDAHDVDLGSIDFWGRPAEDPGHAEAVEAATVVFGDALVELAALLGLELDDRRCTVEFAHETVSIQLSFVYRT